MKHKNIRNNHDNKIKKVICLQKKKKLVFQSHPLYCPEDSMSI